MAVCIIVWGFVDVGCEDTQSLFVRPVNRVVGTSCVCIVCAVETTVSP